MNYLIIALVLFALAFIAIPILIWILKGTAKLVRIVVEILIALLIIGGITLLIVHFV